MKKHVVLLSSTFLAMGAGCADRTEANGVQPNILFLVVEDTSPYLYPAYGNQSIQTPNLDRLAGQGVVFTNAFANAPYCSPARSALISGSYATTYGNDWHRNGHIVPGQYFFPQYLREAGYFTVNAGKTDYNVTQSVQRKWYPVAWDKMSASWGGNNPNVSYNDEEREGRPFFAQFNNNTTHMSRMTSVYLSLREPTRLDPQQVELPEYVPDLAETRSDYALHLDGVEDTDKWVGLFLEDLEERGLLDNTIIFYFSDHGGCLPRGKAFPYETGFSAALIISAPPKWQHLLPATPGTISDRLVEFADFGPTLLSIAGVKPPDHMQGKAFMGQYKEEPRQYSFNYRTNTGIHFDPSRAVFTDDYQYIRNYMPYKKHGLRQSFQWGMPAQMAWDSLFHFVGAAPEHQQYYLPKPWEMLFDRKADPFGMNNLAHDPAYAHVVAELRKEASNHIRVTKDLGFFPGDVRQYFVDQGISLYEWVRENPYPFDLLHEAAERASVADLNDLNFFRELLSHDRPEIRFWGASGLACLAHKDLLARVPDELHRAAADEFTSVASTAAEAMVYAGETTEGLDVLVKLAEARSSYAISSLEQLGHRVRPVLPQIREIAKTSNNGGIRFTARSILINFGEMPMVELFEPNEVEGFLRGQKDRVENWAPTRP
jgi:N-sulfoglucosamine sulfohydrolase